MVHITSKKTVLVGPWHYCARCDERTLLDIMQWQRGLLLCPTCVDVGEHPLIGDREKAISNKLSIPSEELKPHPKLSDPNVINIIDEDISF